MQASIVPHTEHTTYLLMDEIGEYGNVWREMSEGEANEATIVQWFIQGQINRPVKIVAFNTEEGWSRDITHDIATKLLDLNQQGAALSAAAREFVERVTGETAKVIV
jgi:hypothetical protein